MIRGRKVGCFWGSIGSVKFWVPVNVLDRLDKPLAISKLHTYLDRRVHTTVLRLGWGGTLLGIRVMDGSKAMDRFEEDLPVLVLPSKS